MENWFIKTLLLMKKRGIGYSSAQNGVEMSIGGEEKGGNELKSTERYKERTIPPDTRLNLEARLNIYGGFILNIPRAAKVNK